MTLEEAILHAEKVYEEKLDERSYALEWHDNEEAEECQKCADEHKQLAEWLKELAERRKLPEIIYCGECKHNPKLEWFGCPASHLSEKQKPDNAWCWRGERRTDE